VDRACHIDGPPQQLTAPPTVATLSLGAVLHDPLAGHRRYPAPAALSSQGASASQSGWSEPTVPVALSQSLPCEKSPGLARQPRRSEPCGGNCLGDSPPTPALAPALPPLAAGGNEGLRTSCRATTRGGPRSLVVVGLVALLWCVAVVFWLPRVVGERGRAPVPPSRRQH
jgi:hypothetical protein